MAMNKTTLGALMRTKIDAVRATLKRGMTAQEQDTYETAFFEGLAEAIIDHISAAATISPLTVSNTPSDGTAHNHAPAATNSAVGKIS